MLSLVETERKCYNLEAWSVCLLAHFFVDLSNI